MLTPRIPHRVILVALLAASLTFTTSLALPIGTGVKHNVESTNFDFIDESTGTAATVILVGTTIVWNNTLGSHTVTADDGSFESGNLPPGSTWSHTFSAPGTFTYNCRYHVGMRGAITVV